MSDRERTGKRDLLYSRCHRPEFSRRYVGGVKSAQLLMIDLDGLEYCPTCHRTLVLIETKNSSSEPRSFPTYVTATLGEDAGVRAYCVCYTCVCGITGEKHEDTDGCDISEYRVQQINPRGSGDAVQMAPAEYFAWLYDFRLEHWRFVCAHPPVEYGGP